MYSIDHLHEHASNELVHMECAFSLETRPVYELRSCHTVFQFPLLLLLFLSDPETNLLYQEYH